MRKFILVALLLVNVSQINAQSKWNAGISMGCVTNISKFSSGDETANALFDNYPLESFGLSVNFRNKISEKFSLQTGITFTEIGFSYEIAKDYSLLKPWEGSDGISSSTGMISIPVMAILNTPLNCSRVRFVFGAGVAIRGINSNWYENDIQQILPDEGGNTAASFMSSETKTTSCISPALTWQIGLEKVLRKGNSLSFVFTGNQGLTTIAKSTVSYTATNKNYEHTFINRGSFVNLALAYNFMSFGTKKAAKNILKNN